MSTTPSPTVTLQQGNIPALFAIGQANVASTTTTTNDNSNVVTKDPPSSSDAELEEELNKLAISERTSESSGSAVLPTPNATPTPPPQTKITPPPEEQATAAVAELVSTETQTHAVEEEEEEEEQESPRESSPSDSLHGNEGEEASGGNEGEFEAEVDSEIQEVQIELIESSEGYEKLCESQECLDMSPPTIQIDDNDEEGKQEIKSAHHQSSECVVAEVEQSEPKDTPQRSPSVSAKQSPEKESTVEALASHSEKGSPIEHQQEQQQPQEELPPSSPLEELSPTTDEYQEGLEFGDDGKNDFDIADSESTVGYIPPAPTPAPSMAPLAEMDTDTVDEEYSEELKPKEIVVSDKTAKLPLSSITKTTADEARKKRKKRHLDTKKSVSAEEKEKEKASTSAAVTTATVVKESSSAKPEADITTVCPWEDE